MKIVKTSCTSYTLKLKRPFSTSKGVITERKGFLIKLFSEKGNKGYGDCCPLPEFGSETYEQVEKLLQDFQLKIIVDLDDIERSILKTVEPLNEYSNLKHAFEQALLNLVSREQNISLNEILNASSKKIINVNGIIPHLNPGESASRAVELVSNGFKTLKMKVGREKFEHDYDCIKSVREALGNEIKVRLDANGKWDLPKAVSSMKRLEELSIEYIEQPVNKLEDFIKLSNQTTIPLAADESIRTLKDIYDFVSKKAASVLILKPMMLGGIIPTIKTIEFAHENKIKTVITTSLDSVIGRSFAVLAASFVDYEIAHGLGTAELFEKDLYPDPYPVKSGQINLVN